MLSAFLLFQVQPLIAKLILPWFGGSAAVWTSCMLFFQLALLGGYGYAHWINRQPGSRQTAIHVALLAVSLLSLPIVPSVMFKPAGGADPLMRILGLLTATVGLPYFLLSSTSPLLQSWYSRSNGGAMPYRFFALSNFGSMLGLLTYPVLVEPNLTNRQQAWMWSITYVLFTVVCVTVALRSRSAHAASAESDVAAAAGGGAPTVGDRLVWMALAATASAMLLAVTNHLTQNVAAIPFLWVLPLSLYLLSFILCFDSDKWYRRWWFTRLGAVALPAMAYAISGEGNISNLKLAVGFFSAMLFILFMVCHGELSVRRPAPKYLTSFYLMVSLGGAIGGLLIGFLAPYVFNALYDLPVVISLAAFLFVYLLWRDRKPAAEAAVVAGDEGQFLNQPLDKIVVSLLSGGLLLFVAVRLAAPKYGLGPAVLQAPFLSATYDTYVLLGIAAALALFVMWRSRDSAEYRFVLFTIAAGLSLGMAGYMARDTWSNLADSRVLVRNFYGALRVYDSTPDENGMGPVRTLKHGTIDHGEQYLWPQHERFATTYYAEHSGIGIAIQTLQPSGPMNVGMIGLGAGTITTYARPMDHYYIYDINTAVVNIAKTQFHFLQNCMAPYQILLGDARLTLDAEPSRQFDVLAVDAFSGDAIPVHLLTREAFKLYWRHLKPDGVLAVHVSNRYLRLAPVVALAAAEDGKKAMNISLQGDDEVEIASSDWVLVSSRPGFYDQPNVKRAADTINPVPGLRMWTDDYSNLYKILR